MRQGNKTTVQRSGPRLPKCADYFALIMLIQPLHQKHGEHLVDLDHIHVAVETLVVDVDQGRTDRVLAVPDREAVMSDCMM